VLIEAPGPAPDRDRLEERLARVLEQPFEVGGHRLILGASVGVADYPEDGADAETLVRAADEAMFAAKRERRRDCDLPHR
jgi:GGDEF domain-containing protein